MIRTNIDLAIASLKASRIRSLLTMVAVIIGVASFTIVTTTIDGLSKTTEDQIQNLGGNLITINPGKLIREDERGNKSINPNALFSASTLTEKDLDDVTKQVKEIEAIAPQIIISGQVSRNEKILDSALVIATNQDYPDAFGQTVENGTFLTEKAIGGNFAVVGSNVVDELYSGELALGTQVRVRGEPFTVVGSMEENESGLDFSGIDLDNAIFISLKSSAKLTKTQPLIREIDIQLKEGADPSKATEQIEKILITNHGGEEDFTVLQQSELIELTNSLFGLIRNAGQFLSYIMLGVASIVILLIMLITVRERTREIGVRKSIGATNLNILVQFLTEAVVLSWVGSLIGLAVAFGAGFFVKNLTDITPSYTVSTAVTILIISTVVGALAGLAPAWMAARKNPVESLRNE